MKYWLVAIFAVFSLFFFALPASAHPGNTDAYGCHTCRTNCPKWGLSTGEYHCHRSKGLPQPTEPIKSKLNTDGGQGYTLPAPEYKDPAPKKTEIIKYKPVVENPAAKTESPKPGFWRRVFGWLF